jgi:hypothetical protein
MFGAGTADDARRLGGGVVMPRKVSGEATVRRFTLWAVVLWILLLLAALASAQYLQHGDYSYLVGALLVFAVCACCILRLAWARLAMRMVAVLLAIWWLATAVLMLHHRGDFDLARQHAMTQPQISQLAIWMIDRAQRTWEVGLAFKLLAVPMLLWLAWRLGRPEVRAQFGVSR